MKTNDRLIELVKKVKAGNSAAFTDLYSESYKYLHTCVIHIVKDEDIAQDMLQDTYVEIYKNINQLKDDAGFLGWASTIANRKCFAYLKKNKDLLVDEQTDDDGNETDYFDAIADDEAFIPENILDNQEKINIIRGIIDGLTDVQRACVIGFYYNEQKQEEIAYELGLPVNTVKSHLNRAKAKIKEAVGDTEKKQGIKLYSIAPFMLLFFVKDTEVYAAEMTVPAMSAGLSTLASGSTATSSAVATGAKAAGMAVKTKILAGIVAGAVIVGGITGVMLHKEKPTEPEVLEETAEESFVQEVTEESAETFVDVTINLDDILSQISLNGTKIIDMTYSQYSSMEGAIEARNGDGALFGYARYGNNINFLWQESGNIQIADGTGATSDDNIVDVFKSWTIDADTFLDEYADGLHNMVLDKGTVNFNNGQMIFRMFPSGQGQICLSFDEPGAFGINSMYINSEGGNSKVISYGFEKTDARPEGKPLAEYDIDVNKTEDAIAEVEGEQSDKDFWSKNNLSVCNDNEIAVPYMLEFKNRDSGEPIGMELDGTSIVKNDNVIKFTGAEVTYDNGYKDITITYEGTATAFFLYENEDATDDYSIKKAVGGAVVFDKYTGLIMKTDGDAKGDGIKNDTATTVEYGDKEYQIGYVKENNWDSDWGDYLPYNSDLNIPECLKYQDFYSTLTCDLKFHVPEDYDGLVIAFTKKGIDRFAKTDEEKDDTLYYMFEPDKDGECLGSDDYYYFLVSDLLEQFN